MIDGTGAEIVCGICGGSVDPEDSQNVRQYTGFHYVHKKCEQSEALADMAKVYGE